MKIVSPTTRNRALTLVELCIVIVVIVASALFFALQPDRNGRARALRVQCVNNLKQIGQAFDAWASDHGEKFPTEISQTHGGSMEFTTGPNEWRHFQVMSNELWTPMVLHCPSEKLRTSAANFASLRNSNMSYFINLDYSRPSPQLIWSGDRNLNNGVPVRDGVLELTTNPPAAWTGEMHHKAGNLLMFDGSVQRVDRADLQNAIANSGASTNRLQMPILGP